MSLDHFTIACIGLGRVGAGIAPNLQASGCRLVIYNRTPARMKPVRGRRRPIRPDRPRGRRWSGFRRHFAQDNFAGDDFHGRTHGEHPADCVEYRGHLACAIRYNLVRIGNLCATSAATPGTPAG